MPAKPGMAGQHRMIEEPPQERLGWPVVLSADADAERREVVEKEIDPMVRRHDHQHVRPRGAQAIADAPEALLDRRPRRRRQAVPLAGDHRPVTGGENSGQFSHGSTPVL
jgi:hypothetical protein